MELGRALLLGRRHAKVDRWPLHVCTKLSKGITAHCRTMGTVGIPVKLLHEALGHTVTIELKGGTTYRGRLFDGMWRSCVKITTSLTRV